MAYIGLGQVGLFFFGVANGPYKSYFWPLSPWEIPILPPIWISPPFPLPHALAPLSWHSLAPLSSPIVLLPNPLFLSFPFPTPILPNPLHFPSLSSTCTQPFSLASHVFFLPCLVQRNHDFVIDVSAKESQLCLFFSRKTCNRIAISLCILKQLNHNFVTYFFWGLERHNKILEKQHNEITILVSFDETQTKSWFCCGILNLIF